MQQRSRRGQEGGQGGPVAARALLAATCTLVLACAPGPTEGAYQHTPTDEGGLTLCLNGAGGREHPGNVVIDELCRGLPGLVEDCQTSPCWPSFRFSDVEAALAAVRGVLDEAEAEAEVDGAGGPVRLLGYSWGGVSTVDVVGRLVAEGRAVDRVVLVDPYSPFAPRPLDLADGVGRVWVYRHSVAPESDCSRNRPVVGPYLGIAPRCGAEGVCLDYDYSLDERWADLIGHCTVTEVARDPARINLVEGRTAVSDELPVARPAELR